MKAILILLLVIAPAMAEYVPANGTRENIGFEGYQGFVIRPTTARQGRWLWLMPAWLLDDGAFKNYADNALDSGMTVVGLEIGVTLGSPIAAALNQRFYSYAINAYQLSPKPVLLLQSNGNTSGIAWARRHPRRVEQIIGIYPVFDLRDWPTKKAIKSTISPAFRYPLSQLSTAQPLLNLAPLARYQVPFLVLHGDADQLVHYKQNAVAARKAYQKLGGRFELVTINGKGHQVDPEFHQNRRVTMALFAKCTGISPIIFF